MGNQEKAIAYMEDVAGAQSKMSLRDSYNKGVLIDEFGSWRSALFALGIYAAALRILGVTILAISSRYRNRTVKRAAANDGDSTAVASSWRWQLSKPKTARGVRPVSASQQETTAGL